MEDTQGKIFFNRTDSTVFVLLATMIFGGIIIIFGYIVSRYSRSHGVMDSTKGTKKMGKKKMYRSMIIHVECGATTISEKGKRVDSRNSLAGSTTNSSITKRTKNKKRRETQQEFTHSWVVGTLKGHTGTIFNMSFSSNGKLLASCAEDGKQPKEVVPEGTGEPSTKSFYQPNTTMVGCAPPPVTIKDDWPNLNPGYHSANSSVILENHHHHHHHVHQAEGIQQPLNKPNEQNMQPQPPILHTVENHPAAIIHYHDCKLNSQEQMYYMRQMQIQAQMYYNSNMLRHGRLEALHSNTEVNHYWQLHRYQLQVLAQQQQQHQQQQQLQAQIHQQHLQQQQHHQLQMLHQMQEQLQMQEGRIIEERMEKATTANGLLNNTNASFDHSSASFNNSNISFNNINPSLNSPNVSAIKAANSSSPYYNENFCIDKVPTLSFTMRHAFNINDATLEYVLRCYTHHTYYLIEAGYPFSWNFDFRIKRYIHNLHQSKNHNRPLDVNAKEFIPGPSNSNNNDKKFENCDSGNSSSNSDMEPDNLIDDEQEPRNYIRSASFSTNRKSLPINMEDIRRQRRNSISGLEECSSVETRCSRCLRSFYMYQTNGENTVQESCVHHTGELSFHKYSKFKTWTCCKQRTSSLGCITNSMHDWMGLKKNLNGPFVNFVRTKPTKKFPINGIYGIYGVDCEMVITKNGFELAKISMVNVHGLVVYDHFVKPMIEVIDYNTKYSGITANDLNAATKTLKDVQQDLMGFITAETILIGHGLENDLRALHMIHFTVIDTALLLRHSRDLPFRHSLKKLTKSLLQKDIQESSHDSIEDARAAIDLVLWKLKSDGF
uniref:uncharacterized protein LOC127072036 isoform X2 n=1 Tax=Vespula vulgaris TaxID=7454 RepID=UPI00223C1D3B|nr:uncharacterized protein LOC127072036 isoform X2 [Vespula vulgaris]XP_050868021.1 uncharacterized protein LOC127072036 isoform X2 [Vespula vulgaris]